MRPGQLKTIQHELQARMAKEVEAKVRAFIELSDDDKLKGAMKALQTREDQMRSLTEVGAHLIRCMKNLYTSKIKNVPLSSAEQFDIVETIQKASRVFIEDLGVEKKEESGLVLPGGPN